MKRLFLLLFLSVSFFGCTTVEPGSSEKSITSFAFLQSLNPRLSNDYSLKIDGIEISGEMPFGVSINNLVPSISISPKAFISPDNEVAQDFSQPASYTVTAEDGSTLLYNVTLIEEDPYVNLSVPNEVKFTDDFAGKPLDASDNLLLIGWDTDLQAANVILDLNVDTDAPTINYSVKFGDNAGVIRDVTGDNDIIFISDNQFTFKRVGLYKISGSFDNVTDEIYIRIISNVPDINFRDKLKAIVDLGQAVFTSDGVLITDDARITSSTILSIQNSLIISIRGIEHFINLETLNCFDNKLQVIDISKNVNLLVLTSWNNQMSQIDVTKNILLTRLDCNNNLLEALDVSQNKELISLGLTNNLISEIDISKNLSLSGLIIGNNSLSSIDLSKNSNLQYLQISNNQLITLNLSNNTKLLSLWCSENNLTDLDVSGLTNLSDLVCSKNNITGLNLADNKRVSILLVDSNQLTDLDLSQNTDLTQMHCNNNPLSSLTFSVVSGFTKNPSYIRMPHQFACSNEVKSFKLNNPNLNIITYENNSFTVVNDDFDPNIPGACN